MATVFFMRFNKYQGAMVADEKTWHLSFKYGYRPTRYGDSILNLLDSDFSLKNNFSAVYAGVGFPSLHFEIARKARKSILKEPGCIGDLDRTSVLAGNIFQDVHGRMINDRLRFLFGFTRDELNRGKFKFEDKEYEIKQEAVIKEAKAMLKFQDKADAFKRIFDNEGLVMGYDKDNGIRAYHIDNKGRGLDFAYDFDAIGPGKEIGTKIFADINARMHLDERRNGFKFIDGLFLLMNCFVESYDFNTKTGGYIQLFLFDAKREVVKNFTDEIYDHSTYVTAEIIRAYRWGFINKESAQNMMERVLILKEEWEPIEQEMFQESSNPEKLRKYLMGYRPVDIPNMPLS